MTRAKASQVVEELLELAAEEHDLGHRSVSLAYYDAARVVAIAADSCCVHWPSMGEWFASMNEFRRI